MSWLKLAVNKVIEEENKKKANFSRIRNVVDNVVLHAGHVVSSGVNLFQDRNVSQSQQSFKQEMRRLEDDFISCRGKERVLLLQKLLGLLVQIERMNQNFSDDDKRQVFQQDKNVEDNKEITEVSCYDLKHPNYANEELSLYEVFFQSQVIERILLSMILEAPNDEEINHLHEIFRVILIAEKDLHISVIHWIKDLAKVFSTYHEEILMKREELLQFAQVAITGLKKNVDITRIDLEANNLKSQVYSIAIKPLCIEDDHALFQPKSFLTAEALKEALYKIEVCSKFKSLMLKKMTLQDGQTQENYACKVNKLKILLRSLTNSVLKAEKRIFDHKNHKDETQHFGSIKAFEVSLTEKELIVEIEMLEQQKEKLELELEKVNNSLDMAITRLDNAKEERSQFHEASNTMIQHLQMKEKELSTYITSCKTEAGVIVAWNKFIEHAWDIQYALFKKNEKQVINELKKYGKFHVEMILHTLKTYENMFRNMVGHFKVLARRLKLSEESDETFHLDDDNFVLAITRKTLEEEYLQLESQLINAFTLIESIQETYKWGTYCYRDHEEEVRLLLEIFMKIKEEFESLERPNIEHETIDKLSWKGRPLKTRIGKEEMIDTLDLLEYDEETPKTESAKCIEEKFKEEIVDWEFDAIAN